jgi:hypothetical protein
MTKLTTAPLTGLPFTSFTWNWIVAVSDWPEPLIPRILGDADTNCMLPAETLPMVRDAVLLLPPDVAVIVREPEAVPAVNVVVATPAAVVTVVLDRLP